MRPPAANAGPLLVVRQPFLWPAMRIPADLPWCFNSACFLFEASLAWFVEEGGRGRREGFGREGFGVATVVTFRGVVGVAGGADADAGATSKTTAGGVAGDVAEASSKGPPAMETTHGSSETLWFSSCRAWRCSRC